MPLNLVWGLWAAALPSKKLSCFFSSEFGFDPNGDAANSIKVSTKCRFSPLAVCHKGDVVLFKDGNDGFKAGKFQLQCEVYGLTLSMISVLAIHKLEPHAGYSVWTFLHQETFIEVDQMLEAVVHSEVPDGKIAALLSLEFRPACWKKGMYFYSAHSKFRKWQ